MSSTNNKGKMAIFVPKTPLKAKICIPGSKSITNRALLISSLANGHSILKGALKSDDTIVMANALRLMGIKIDDLDNEEINIFSSGKLNNPKEEIFLGNAGTATRFLTAAASLIKDGDIVISGDEDMQKRPIKPLVNALKSIGINISSKTGCPPVLIKAKGAKSINKYEVQIDASLSSQYVSALLILAPMLEKQFTISFGSKDKIGGRGYIDLTLSIMRDFGAKVSEIKANVWQVEPSGYKTTNYTIAPDFSSITYLWAIEKLVKSELELYPLIGLENQPDAKAHKFIKLFPNMPRTIDGSQMQDAIPTLAIMAAFNNNPVRFTGIENLRVKECDRIFALNKGLNAIFDGLAKIKGDDLIINGNPNLKSPRNPVLIDSFNDHRIAMSFALMGLKLENIIIDNPNCVSKTYANFWNDLNKMGVKTTYID